MCVCMITGMVFLYVNVCLYLNVNFVILYVVVQRAKRKTAVAILVPQFSYFNFHMNFSCKLSVYIYICFLCMKIENKFYSILFYTCHNCIRFYLRRKVLLSGHKNICPGTSVTQRESCYVLNMESYIYLLVTIVYVFTFVERSCCVR